MPYFEDFHQPTAKPKRSLFHYLKIVFFIVLIFFITSSYFSYKVIFSQESFLQGLSQLPVVKQIRKLVGWSDGLKGYYDDRINILILGQGGVGHEGPYLTDTIIFASIKPSTGQVAMFSIPRDFLVEIPNKGWYKINAVNAFGETENYPGGGSALAAEIIGNVFDMPIHYWLRVDFEAFKEIIDKVEGVEICIDKSFTDYFYPTDDYLYQTISFEQGCHIMDGDMALKFSRSRHGTNGQGSDFARAARQQKVILALKDKIFDWKTVFNPNLLYSIFDITEKNIQTNVKKSELIHFLDLAQKIVDSEVKKRVLDNSQWGLLKAELTAEGAYVLVPRISDYSELKNLAKNIFILPEQAGEPEEQVKVIILNGSEITGLAQDTAGLLSSLSYNITSTGNAQRTDFEKTVIYDLSSSSKKDALKILKQILDANVTDEVPEFLSEEIKNNADFIIVLGCSEYEERCQEKVKSEK